MTALLAQVHPRLRIATFLLGLLITSTFGLIAAGPSRANELTTTFSYTGGEQTFSLTIGIGNALIANLA